MNQLVSIPLEHVRAYAPAAFSTVAHPRTSDRYSLFTTADIIDGLVKEGWQVTRANQSAVHTDKQRAYSRHLVALSRPEFVYKDEQVEFMVINSNDGRSKYHTELGVYKFACSNGLIDTTHHFAEMDIRHFGYEIEQVLSAGQKLIERVPQVIEVIDAWKGKQLPYARQLEFAMFALAQRYPENAPIQPGDLLTRRRIEDSYDSLWTIFNVVQENLLQGGQSYEKETKRGLRNLKVRPIRSIGTNLSVNRTLWSAAEAVYNGEDLVLPA